MHAIAYLRNSTGKRSVTGTSYTNFIINVIKIDGTFFPGVGWTPFVFLALTLRYLCNIHMWQMSTQLIPLGVVIHVCIRKIVTTAWRLFGVKPPSKPVMTYYLFDPDTQMLFQPRHDIFTTSNGTSIHHINSLRDNLQTDQRVTRVLCMGYPRA